MRFWNFFFWSRLFSHTVSLTNFRIPWYLFCTYFEFITFNHLFIELLWFLIWLYRCFSFWSWMVIKYYIIFNYFFLCSLLSLLRLLTLLRESCDFFWSHSNHINLFFYFIIRLSYDESTPSINYIIWFWYSNPGGYWRFLGIIDLIIFLTYIITHLNHITSL